MGYVFAEKYVVWRFGFKRPVAGGSYYLYVPLCPLFVAREFWKTRSGFRVGDSVALDNLR